MEHLVTKQIKARVLREEVLEELVKLVNEELDSAHSLLKERLDIRRQISSSFCTNHTK